MLVAAVCSVVFGWPGYTYFGLVAVPATVSCVFLSLGQKINWRLIAKATFLSIVFLVLAYIPFIVTISQSIYMNLVGLTVSICIIICFLSFIIPKILKDGLVASIKLRDSFVSSLFLTAVCVLGVFIYVNTNDNFGYFSEVGYSEALLIILPILFFVSPYLYIKSFANLNSGLNDVK